MSAGLAQRLVVGLAGPWPNAREWRWLEAYRPAGVILFSRNVIDFNQLVDLCRELHNRVPGLEIMADHEGGPVSQLAAALGRPPAAWALGVTDDTGLTARVWAETAARMRAAGLDRVLAPVADVMTEPANPVIGCRAFGATPDKVARHTVAAVTGILTGGLQVCLKHWPGHGGAVVDSHHVQARVGRGADATPFAAGLAAGAGAIMVGHLITGDGELMPATLDKAALASGRSQWAGNAVGPISLFADDVSMGGLGPAMKRAGVLVPPVDATGLFPPDQLTQSWFDNLVRAGCDRLLIRSIPFGAFPLAANADDSPADALASDTPLAAAPPSFDPAPYREARSRLWAGVDGFCDPEADLCWADFAAADRWQVAAGSQAACLPGIRGILEGSFRSVVGPPVGGEATGLCRRLLVTSHRPLNSFDPNLLPLAKHGVCLTMGHPVLGPQMTNGLGPGWRIVSLFDVSPEDLGVAWGR